MTIQKGITNSGSVRFWIIVMRFSLAKVGSFFFVLCDMGVF